MIHGKVVLPKNKIFTSTQTTVLAKKLNTCLMRPEIGFADIPRQGERLEETRKLWDKFLELRKRPVKTFLHLGIGGSSLGPKAVLSALGSPSGVQFLFADNIDPDTFSEQLDSLNWDETAVFVVSKSGGTAETMAQFSIVLSKLLEAGVSKDQWKESVIVATDPVQGPLRKMTKDFELLTLAIPSDVGGRFSVLTPVGMLPALAAGIDIEEMRKGALSTLDNFLSSNGDSFLYELAETLIHLKSEGVNQTVLMPYSSKLKKLSEWFVQLWAESLGKAVDKDGKTVFTGLTPIPGHGATDQHAQVQLFMEGPYDKCLLFIHLKKFQKDIPLSTNSLPWKLPSEKFGNSTMGQLMEAEFRGTCQALEKNDRPFSVLSIEQLTPHSLGELIMFFQLLTATVGEGLNIDSFNQPGVELGKVYAFEWLAKLRS